MAALEKRYNSIDQLIEQHMSRRRSDIGDMQRLMDGDHWLDGRGWVGPRPEGEDATKLTAMIKDQFVWKNLISEVCRRHRDSVVGREPAWRFVPNRALAEDEEPTAEEQALIDELEAAMTDWFDEYDVFSELQEAALYALWAQSGIRLRAAGTLRVYIPESSLEADENGEAVFPYGLELTDILSRIRIAADNPQDSSVVYDRNGEPLFAYLSYQEEDQDVYEVTGLAENLAKLDALEGEYPDGTTIVQRRVNQDVVSEVAYDLQGRTLVNDVVRRETLVPDSVVSQQKLLNMALTMTGRNVVQAGFLERLIMNAQVPGDWYDEDGKRDPINGTVFKPKVMQVGAGTTNILQGLEIIDEATDKVRGYTTPSVTYRDPVSVQTFRDTLDMARQSIYEETQQLHVMISGDATTSGQSRIQATNDFVSSLNLTAGGIEKGFRRTLEAVLSLVATLSGDPTRYAGVRAEVECLLSAVQPSADEIRAVIEQYNAELISRETAMSRNGIEDVDAELQKINTELDQGMQRRPPVITPYTPVRRDGPEEAEDAAQGTEEAN